MSRAEKIKSSLFYPKTVAAALAALTFLLAAGGARAQIPLTEGFDNVSQLPSLGWVMRNNSAPIGTTGWFQGNPNVFPSQAGATNSYIAADFNNTSGTGTISNWLLTPQMNLYSGSFFRFWTRTRAGSPFPDRLEVRVSTNGASTNVGTGANDVGDFTHLLLRINPNLEVGGYPDNWMQFTVSLTGLDLGCFGVGNGRLAFRYFVTGAGPTGSNSNYIGIDTLTTTIAIPRANALLPTPPLDYNCDGKTDYVVTRNAGSQMTWFINNGTTNTQTPWGIATDIPVSGDFDGDRKSDITVYRAGAPPNSFFYTLRSSNNTLQSSELGATGDDPTVVGDYDGDAVADYAVYRRGAAEGQPSFWYYRRANGSGITFVQYGQYGDTPAPGDYDGDGKRDFCVRRGDVGGQGVFYLRKSSGTADEAVFWGTKTDRIVPDDYDGDGRTDFAVVRVEGSQLLWSVLGRSNYNVIHYALPWGVFPGSQPAPGQYDGDGRADIAVWSTGDNPAQNFFYVRSSINGAFNAIQWGQPGDYPVANYNSH